MLDDRNNKAIGITLLMVIQHGGDVLVGKQYENSRCSVQPSEYLVSTQPLVSQFDISHFNHHEHYVLHEAQKTLKT